MSIDSKLPACGLYRTSVPIGEVPAQRLVFFHNHGDPGPGIYLPEGWSNNIARFGKRGTTLSSDSQASTLSPVPREGLYVVTSEFVCCEKNCRTYAPQTFVQLGYNQNADAILFLPTFGPTGVHLPDRGTRIDASNFEKLQRLKVEASVIVKPSVVH